MRHVLVIIASDTNESDWETMLITMIIVDKQKLHVSCYFIFANDTDSKLALLTFEVQITRARFNHRL